MAAPDNPNPETRPRSTSVTEASSRSSSPRPGTDVGTGHDEEAGASGAPVREGRRSRRPSGRSAPPVLFGLTADQLLVWTICGASAVSGALAAGRPTGHAALDAVLRAAFAFAVAFVVPRARRWTWIVLSGAAAVVSSLATAGNAVPLAAAWVALGLAVVAVVFPSRRHWLGALIGALAAGSLLRLAPVGPFGTTAVVAGVAVLPAFLSAYQRERRRTRKRILRMCLAGCALLLLAAGGVALAGALSVDNVDTGVAEARLGLDAAKRGDATAADQHLSKAATEFGAAEGRFSSWYAWPAKYVPVLSYQAHALQAMSTVGHDLSALARTTSKEADFRGLALNDGRIDVARVQALEKPLSAVNEGLGHAQSATEDVGSDWLAGPLRDRFDTLQRQLDDSSRETHTALAAVRVAPALLGQDEVRNYFIAFTTPSESRGLGGFMGSWAVLTADHGKLELTRNGRVADLVPQAGDPPRTLDASAEYLDRYGALHPERIPGDVTFSPDFPSVARALASIYAQSAGGGKIDGALSLDPYALAGLLQITGPIKVPGLAAPLEASNAADYLLRQQYLDFDRNQQRVDVLDDVAHATFDAFIHARDLKPAALATALGPSVDEGRILGYSFHPAEEELIELVRIDGTFPRPGAHDFFSLVTQNGGNNKIDVFLHREIDYRASFDPATGATDANAVVTLRNEAPSTGLPDYVIKNRESSGQPRGANWVWFNFYSPHDLVTISVDGQPFPVGVKKEFGLNVFQGYVAVPSQGQVKIALHLTGHVDPATTYAVSWHQQPLVHPDDVRVFVRAIPPWVPKDPVERDAPVGAPTLAVQSRADGSLEVPLTVDDR